MIIEISNKAIGKVGADINVVLVVNKDFAHPTVSDKEFLEFCGFNGESEESLFVQSSNTLYVGCDSLEAEDIRLACAKAYEALKKTKAKTIKIATYSSDCPSVNIKAMAEGFILGSYEFNAYKSKNEEKSLEKVIIVLEDYSRVDVSVQTAQNAIDVGVKIADATNYAKDIVNAMPNEMTPEALAKKAIELASTLPNVTCKVFDEEFLKEQGMNAFLAVSRASVHSPRLIHLIYKPENAKKRIVYVGKGLTYDSGGLSLKPSEHMVTMKADKSGASAVMAILKGASELSLPYEIHAIVGATENMIGGNAYKPDDVLIAKNGKTIEVRNTDAEGRLVLADCLCYAQEFKPDELIDMATLTGACVVALGEFTTGVMGHNEAFKQNMVSSAAKSGELSAILPFNKYLKKLLKSSVADMSNISSSRYGGAITAGLFLDNFIEDEYKQKWIHLDIAGPAYIEKAWGYNQFGASGAGVRMNLYRMIDESKDKKILN
ncbi:MAG: leucyl aminopeptidase [Sulfurospirillaceae bacterium]|nr:leucyl aminopeptidase [Sulfurospirillaceae bacterium]